MLYFTLTLSPDQLVSDTKLVRNPFLYLDLAMKKPQFIQRQDGIELVLMGIDEYRKLLQYWMPVMAKLVFAIQKAERDGADLSADDIQAVWEAKTLLGCSHPVSLEEGIRSSV